MFRTIFNLKRQERLILNQLINNDYCEDKFNHKIRDLVRVRNKIESEAVVTASNASESEAKISEAKINESEVRFSEKIPPVKMTRFK